MDRQVRRAAEAIASAAAILVTAGAGMGVDSGLPDFRGDRGFWKAYPPYERLGLSFVQLANPEVFHRDPELAWGFYGHRRRLYRQTDPHEGFEILRRWITDGPDVGSVVTSNVDGHFQAADFDPDAVYEVHGTIHWDQCLAACGRAPWPTTEVPEVDAATMRAVPPLPACPDCDGLARPNILMFGDWGWDEVLADAQQRRFREFLHDTEGSDLAVVECGAGTAIPTIRRIGDDLAVRGGATLIRINPREPQVPEGQVAIAGGALAALRAIDAALDLV